MLLDVSLDQRILVQGFLLSSTQQMVDRLVMQTQETIRTVAQESTDKNNDINLATNLIQDADNSKQVRNPCHIHKAGGGQTGNADTVVNTQSGARVDGQEQ